MPASMRTSHRRHETSLPWPRLLCLGPRRGGLGARPQVPTATQAATRTATRAPGSRPQAQRIVLIAAPPRQRPARRAPARPPEERGQVLGAGVEQFTADQQHVRQADLADVEAARGQRVVLVETRQRLGLEHTGGGDATSRRPPARSPARCARGRGPHPARRASARRAPTAWRSSCPFEKTGSVNVTPPNRMWSPSSRWYRRPTP